MTTRITKSIITVLCVFSILLMAGCGRQSPGEAPSDENINGQEAHQYEYEIYEEYIEYEIYEEYAPTQNNQGIHGLISVVEYGGNRAYIIGSIHIGCESWYPLNPIVEAAIDRADIFAFEIDLAAEGGPCIREYDPCEYDCICALLDMMFLSEGTTLEDFLPAEDFKLFMENLRTYPFLNIDAIATFRPTTILEVILYEIVAPSLGLSSAHSIDMYVFNRAEARERPTIGLTDVNDHIAFISGMPDEYQFATARYFTDFETMLDEVDQLAYIYVTQDIETLTQMVRADLAEAYEAYMAGEISAAGLALARYWHYTVGNYRSAFFARQIAALLRETEEPTVFFVTVGIAHLTREVNVFYMLREMGFEVVGLY